VEIEPHLFSHWMTTACCVVKCRSTARLDGGSLGGGADTERRPAVRLTRDALGLPAPRSGLSERGARPPGDYHVKVVPVVSRPGRSGRSASGPVDRSVHEYAEADHPALGEMAASNENAELQ